MEKLQLKHENLNLHKKMKELIGMQNYKQPCILMGRKERVIIEVEYKITDMETYIKHLFDDERHRGESQHEGKGLKITIEEVCHATEELKCGKAPCPDG